MSNPTTKVATFNGALEGFTGVDPIRYDAGLWLEEAATNLNINPIGKSGSTSGWIQVGTGSISYVDGYLAATRSGTAAVGQTGTGTNRPTVSPGETLSARADLFADATGVGASGRLRIRFFNASDGQVGEQTTDVTLSATPQTVFVAGVAPANTTYAMVAFLFATNGTAGQEIRATNITWRVSTYQTSAIPVLSGGSPAAGYAWTGTAHASTSTRAASSASISPTGILAPGSGAVAFRITPTIETGVEELWGECGTKGAGTDHLRWGRDATKHPFVEWSSDDGSYQRLTSVETADAGIEHFVLIGHNGTDVFIKAAGGARESGTRDAVEGSFGAGDLVLKASVGGNVVGSIATFNRMLTDAEIYTVENTEHWSMGMLGNEMVRRIRAQFELRPAY